MTNAELWLSDLDRVLSDIDQMAPWSRHGKMEAARNDALRQYVYALRDLNRAWEISMDEENEAGIDNAQAAVTGAFNDLIEVQRRVDRSTNTRLRWDEMVVADRH